VGKKGNEEGGIQKDRISDETLRTDVIGWREWRCE